jgi:hypothetical protein
MAVTWTKEPSKVPIEIPQRDGHTIPLVAIVGRSADDYERSGNLGRALLLRGLERSIEELRASPTEKNLGEFLSLYT